MFNFSNKRLALKLISLTKLYIVGLTKLFKSINISFTLLTLSTYTRLQY